MGATVLLSQLSAATPLWSGFRDNQRCVSLPDRDVEIVPEYCKHAPNIVGGVVKVK